MSEIQQYCQSCGSPLQPGFKFCEKCGSPVVDVESATMPAGTVPSYSTVDNLQDESKLKATAKKPSWILPIIGIGCVLLLCIGAFFVGGIFMYYNVQQEETVSKEISPQESGQLEEESEIEEEQTVILTDTPESFSESTVAATETETETEPVLTATEEPGVEEDEPVTTEDILLDYSNQWEVVDTDQYRTDISQRGDWAIGVKQSDITVAVIPPGLEPAGVKNSIITFDASSSAAGQIAGVRCQVQDEKNYYQVSFKDKQFAIGRVADGKLTPLTDPYWQDSQFIGAGGMPGGANIQVTCQGSSIGVSIEGMGEIPLISDPDDRFQSGQIALFAAPGEAITDEFFSFAIFNNLTIEALP